MLSLIVSFQVGIFMAVFHGVTEILASVASLLNRLCRVICLQDLILHVRNVFCYFAAEGSFRFLTTAPVHIPTILTLMRPTRPIEVILRIKLLMAIATYNLGNISSKTTLNSLCFAYQHFLSQNMPKYAILRVFCLVTERPFLVLDFFLSVF